MVASKNSDGKKVEKVKFDIGNYKNKSFNAAVRAIVYTRDGKSHLEDWNSLSQKTFDFKKGGKEDAVIVVLVLANADTKKELPKSTIKISSTIKKASRTFPRSAITSSKIILCAFSNNFSLLLLITAL